MELAYPDTVYRIRFNSKEEYARSPLCTEACRAQSTISEPFDLEGKYLYLHVPRPLELLFLNGMRFLLPTHLQHSRALVTFVVAMHPSAEFLNARTTVTIHALQSVMYPREVRALLSKHATLTRYQSDC